MDITYAKIAHIINLYGFNHWEAWEYLAYSPYDAKDWANTLWENEQC